MESIQSSTVMVRVSLGGDSVEVEESAWMTEADRLVEKHGGGVPQVERLGGDPAPTTEAQSGVALAGDDQAAVDALEASIAAARNPAPLVKRQAAGLVLGASPSAPIVRGVTVSETGKARSQRDFDAAVAAGFSPAQTLYDRGTMVVELGVENARQARSDWEQMPEIAAACQALAERVKGENRTDVLRKLDVLAMTTTGQLRGVDDEPLVLAYGAFRGMLARAGIGGAQYLSECWPELRAHNVNQWIGKIVEDAGIANREVKDLVFRTRDTTKKTREIFAAVSPTYTPFDADLVCAAVSLAAKDLGGRGRVSYDGQRTRIEALWHSTVAPEDYVAGEFFRGGVVIESDDTGSGSLRGSAVVYQNLCLNLIIIDEAESGSFSIRHTSGIESMATKFRAAFDKSMAATEHFRKAWGYACHDDLQAKAQIVDEDKLPNGKEFMEWLFRGALQDDRIPVLAKRNDPEAVVAGLARAWESDTSASAGQTTRAAFVNALTRYTHTEAKLDPWAEDAVQRVAGQIAMSRRALPYSAPQGR